VPLLGQHGVSRPQRGELCAEKLVRQPVAVAPQAFLVTADRTKRDEAAPSLGRQIMGKAVVTGNNHAGSICRVSHYSGLILPDLCVTAE